MDFRGRSSQSGQTPAATPAATTTPRSSVFDNGSTSGKSGSLRKSKLFQLGSVLLLFSVSALVIALTFLLAFSGGSQERAIIKDKYQAVFLNNGQVYFGNIASIGKTTFDLRNIYYLQTSSTGTASTSTTTTTPTNVSLVKLGCELHAPYDRMLINSEQVIFWENIQDSSQVVKAIANYKTQNAGQACSTQSQSSTDQAPSTTTPTANPTTTTPTPAATTPSTTKKP